MANFEWEKATERERLRDKRRKPILPVATGYGGDCAIHQSPNCESCGAKNSLLATQSWRMKAHAFQSDSDACTLCDYPDFYGIHSADPLIAKQAAYLEKKIFNKNLDAIVSRGTIGGQERKPPN